MTMRETGDKIRYKATFADGQQALCEGIIEFWDEMAQKYRVQTAFGYATLISEQDLADG